MPEFSTNFSVMKADRKLTDEELKRAIRFDIAAEYEAVQLYLQLAESIDNKLAIAVLQDIAKEELEHYDEGAREVEDMMKRLKAKKK